MRKKDQNGVITGGYFEGYIDKQVPLEDGEGTVNRKVYVGDYYSAELDDHERMRRRSLYNVLSIVSPLALALGYAMGSSAINAWYVQIALALAIIPYFGLLGGISCFISAPKRLTIWEYKHSSKQIIRSSQICTAALVLLAVTVVIYAIVAREQVQYALFTIVLTLIATAMFAVINFMERSTAYKTEPSEDKPE